MAETNSITSKTCKRCGSDQPLENYHNDRSRKDGKFPYCRACCKVDAKKHYLANTEKAKAQRRKEYEKNKEKYILLAKQWAEDNPGKRKEIAKRYEAANRDKKAQANKRHREENPGYYRAHFKMRQARKRQALSTWADLEAIEAIYRQCSFVSRFTGIKHHVDHYYPLTSDVVCGLHNQHNLRIIPATENLSKGNNFPDEGIP